MSTYATQNGGLHSQVYVIRQRLRRYKWTALPVLNEPLVGLEANGAGELRLQTAYRGDGCAGVCLREYAVSTRLQLVEKLCCQRRRTRSTSRSARTRSRTSTERTRCSRVTRSSCVPGLSAPVAETVLPSVDLSGQFDVLQLVLSGDQIMLRTGAQVINAPREGGQGLWPCLGSGDCAFENYWSSIRVFRRSAATAPSYELLQSFYDSRNMSGASPYSSAVVMRVSDKRMAVKMYDRIDNLRYNGYCSSSTERAGLRLPLWRAAGGRAALFRI